MMCMRGWGMNTIHERAAYRGIYFAQCRQWCAIQVLTVAGAAIDILFMFMGSYLGCIRLAREIGCFYWAGDFDLRRSSLPAVGMHATIFAPAKRQVLEEFWESSGRIGQSLDDRGPSIHLRAD